MLIAITVVSDSDEVKSEQSLAPSWQARALPSAGKFRLTDARWSCPTSPHLPRYSANLLRKVP